MELDLTVPRDADGSSVLHRLRVLAIPGFVTPTPTLDVRERWAAHEALDADVALIESSIYGPTLETATAGRLRSIIDAAALDASSSDVGRVLVETLLCRLRMLDAILDAAGQAMGDDQRIDRVAAMLDTLSIVASAADVLDAGGLSAVSDSRSWTSSAHACNVSSGCLNRWWDRQGPTMAPSSMGSLR